MHNVYFISDKKEYLSEQLPLAKDDSRFQSVLVALLRNNIASYVEDVASHGIMHMVNAVHFPL